MKLVFFVLLLSACTKGRSVRPHRYVNTSVSQTCSVVYTQSGRYVLDRDIVSNTCAIEIKADNVTLDLNGHLLQGPNDKSVLNYGIVALDRSNVKILNGTVDGFAFGISLTSSNGIGNMIRGNEVTDMTILNSNFRGIVVHGYNSKVDSNIVTETGGNTYYPDAYGFGIEMVGPDCFVSNNVVTDTYGYLNGTSTRIAEGVAISFSFYNTNCIADNNVIRNNRPVANKSTFGFWVDVYSVVTIKNNTISGMHYSGIVPSRTILINNTTDIPIANGYYDR